MSSEAIEVTGKEVLEAIGNEVTTVFLAVSVTASVSDHCKMSESVSISFFMSTLPLDKKLTEELKLTLPFTLQSDVDSELHNRF